MKSFTNRKNQIHLGHKRFRTEIFFVIVAALIFAFILPGCEKKITVNSEAEFIKTFEKILSSKKTKRVMTVLKSMTGYNDYHHENDNSKTARPEDEIPF